MGTKTDTQNAAWLLKPADSDSLNQADDEIRATRRVQQERIAEEHVNLVTTPSNDQGVHKPGSSIIYTGTSFPTKRPDGVTSFTTALDKGRLFVNTSTGVQYVLLTADGADNNVWGAITPSSSFGDFAVGGDLSVATDGVIGRNLNIIGSLDVDTDLNVDGDVVFGGTLSLNGKNVVSPFSHNIVFTAIDIQNDVYDSMTSSGKTGGCASGMWGTSAVFAWRKDFGFLYIYYVTGSGTYSSKAFNNGNTDQIGSSLNIYI